jgi:hypothetical protein
VVLTIVNAIKFYGNPPPQPDLARQPLRGAFKEEGGKNFDSLVASGDVEIENERPVSLDSARAVKCATADTENI